MPAQSLPIAINPTYVDPYPTVSLRLTAICAPTGETTLWSSGDSHYVISSLALRDCEIYGSGATWQMSEGYSTTTVGLTNNVFYRVPFAVSTYATITSFNNLFYGTLTILLILRLPGRRMLLLTHSCPYNTSPARHPTPTRTTCLTVLRLRLTARLVSMPIFTGPPTPASKPTT